MANCGHYLDVLHAEPAVELNAFLRAPQDASTPPTHAAVRHLLPALWGSPWASPGAPHPGRPPPPAPAPAPVPAAAAAHAATAAAAFARTFELLFANLRAAEPANDFAGPYADAAFNRCLFMWDAVFMAVFWRYAARAHDFQGTLDTFYRKQLADGFIPREVRESDGRSQFHRHDPHSTGPNVLPWCELEHYALTRDGARLARVFPPLLAYHNWMRAHRSWPDSSYHSCGYACGMDNQPRVQPGESVTASHSFTAWVDATSQALLSAQSLIAMAEAIASGETAAPRRAAAAAPAAPLQQQQAQQYPGSDPTHLYTLRSCGGGRGSAVFARAGEDGVLSSGSGSPGTPLSLVPVPGTACVELRLSCAGSPYVDLKFGRAAHGNAVWAYDRNGTASQHWVAFVVVPAAVAGGSGGGSFALVPLNAVTALLDAPPNATNPVTATGAAFAARMRATPVWTLVLRSAVQDTLVLAAASSSGGGGAAALRVCVEECPASAPPSPHQQWHLVRCSEAEAGGAASTAVRALAGGPAVAALRREAHALQRYLRERMWCPAQGAFADVRLREGGEGGSSAAGGQWSSTRSVGAYWALVAGMGEGAGALGERELLRFIGALEDVTLFNRPTRVPSLSADHPQYDPQGGYWLGSSWPPTTYVSGCEAARGEAGSALPRAPAPFAHTLTQHWHARPPAPLSPPSLDRWCCGR